VTSSCLEITMQDSPGRSPGGGSRRRSSIVLGADGKPHASFFNALENGALETSSRRSSIGGRLGGSIIRTSAAELDADLFLDDDDDEETHLLKDKKQLPHLLVRKHEHPVQHPPIHVWIVPALACAASYAFYNIFIKKGSYSIHPILGGVVLQFVAALLGTVLLALLICKDKNAKSEIEYDRAGIFWSCCAGLAVGSAEMLSFVVSGLGVPATQSIPIIIGGSVVVGAVLGLLLLGEVMLCHGWSGILLLVIGIGLVATDPGEKVQEGGISDDDVEKECPPMLTWIGPALLCASAYALYNIFIKKGSASINPILGGVILQFVAAIFGTLLLGAITLKKGNITYLNWDYTGLIWACCAGIAVGMGEMLSFCVSGLGVPSMQSIPTIIGGSVGVGAMLGLLMLGEELMLQGWCGVGLLITGIGFVATDPGEKVAGH
jgi:bacterial/archaeal transporter family protein